MPYAFEDMVGNEALRQRLYEDILRERLSHAYIIEGKRGSGKHMLALRIAAALACERKAENTPLPCKTCPACRKILGGNSPDVIYINRADKATLGVDAIRGLRQDVYIPPNDLSTKVYIIEDAHLLTAQAQNAFLLTLEEPPAYVLFLLLCETAAPLLETVKSRAPTLRTEPLTAEQIGEHIKRVSTDAAKLCKDSPDEFYELLAAADGSIGRALELLDPKRRRPILALRETARSFVRLCAAHGRGAAAVKCLAAFSQKREELAEQLSAVLLCLRDLLLIKQCERAPLCFFADREEAQRLSYSFTTPELLALCDCVGDALDKLLKNANVRLTLTTLAVAGGLL